MRGHLSDLLKLPNRLWARNYTAFGGPIPSNKPRIKLYSTDFIKRKAREELQIIIPELGQENEYNLPFSEAEMDYALSAR
jgi:hypothetical protein